MRQARIALAIVIVATAAAAPLWLHAERYHRQRAARLTGIPSYDYKWQTRSPSAQHTATGIMLERRVSELASRLVTDQVFLRKIVQLQKPLIEDAPLPQTTTSPQNLPSPHDSSEDVLEDITPGRPVVDTPKARRLQGAFHRVRGQAPAPKVPRAVDRAADELLGDQRAVESILRESMLELAAVTAPARDMRVYQLDRGQLSVNHCIISNVAVQLHKNGCWVLSLRADQNPRLVDEEQERFVYRPKLHLKRNEFNVRLRCYGLYSGVSAPRTFNAGRPVLADLQPAIFWVERMEPRHVRIACCDPRVAHYFEKINRLEVEFFYR